MSAQWLAELKKLGTNPTKPFLEEAPWLIAVFKQIFEPLEDGMQSKNYYVNESAGIACGILIAAIHDAGLACLTHTPSPMQFLCNILERPDNERPFLLLPVGYPSDNCTVPDIQRKPLENLVTFY
ncbi:MAG: nitroreductase family protein [Flavobacteriales bacterium]